jgi:iron complex outermembrane receptor protein
MSVFDISQPSIITVATGIPPSQQLNGEQRNRGVELNVFGEVTPAIRLLGGLALIDGKQAKTAGGLTDGRTAIGVPTVNANIGAEWDTPFVRDLTLTGRVIYTGQQYVDTANTLKLPDWTRVDIGARYTFTSPWNGKPIVVRANIENVFNQAYWASAYSGVITLAAPRTYLVSTTFNF